VKASGLSAIAQNVLYVDNKPVWSITPNQTIKTVYAIFRSAVNIQLPTAVDPDGDVVTYAATNLPSGLTANSTTGLISGSLADVSSDTTYSPTVKALSTGSDPGATQIETTRTVNIVQKAGIGNSLRFDGTSNLSKSYTTSATDGRKGTWSLFAKITDFSDTRRCLLGSYASPGFDSSIELGATASVGADYINSIYYSFGRTNPATFKTNEKLRDASAWYHLVFVWDTTIPDFYCYINGNIASQVGITQPVQNELSRFFGNGFTTYIGSNSSGSSQYYNGYLANIQFIDGQALSASDFGEPVNGIWTPKTYLGTYGTNGFWLRFDDSSQIGKDSSGNGNHWTAI
jgi:hypothetical protein